MALGVFAIIAACFTKDVIPLMSNHLQVDLHERDHAHLLKATDVELTETHEKQK
jgi:hypothetical protein